MVWRQATGASPVVLSFLASIDGSPGLPVYRGFGVGLDLGNNRRTASPPHQELIAQAIHNEFLRNETLAGRRMDGEVMRPWEQLPEALKESNRDQAADR